MNAFLEALPSVLRAAGESDEVAFAAAVAAWRNVAGETLRDLAIPVQLVDNTLTVAVEDAIWQKQLESMRGQFLFRLKSILGQPLVRMLTFRVAPETVAAARKARLRQLDSLDDFKDDSVIPLELLSAAACIQDPKLRAAFVSAANRSLTRQQKDRKRDASNRS